MLQKYRPLLGTLFATHPLTYILYFKARDRSAINQAMAAYSVAWARQQKQERSATEPTLDPTRDAPAKKVERIRQKGMER